jgi:transglutaminase-like putative cysteine protease
MDPRPAISTPSIVRMLLLLAAAGGIATPAYAQIAAEETSPTSVRYGEPDVIRYQVGAEIKASRGACRDILLMVAVPFECPEQDVRIVDEDITTNVAQVDYRDLQGGVRQMLISIPYLANGAQARAVVTFEVATRPVLPPEETDELTIPDRVSGKLRGFISGSPYIESKHRTIRSLTRDILAEVDEGATDWQKVEAIYDHVLENVAYVEGPDKSAIDALRDGQADCQGRSALFIALCRAGKIPARMVWVDGHCYPEFYLENAAGEGNWYPCESAGSRAFGEMPLARTILQKGDNFRVPERPRDKLRYASDFMIGTPTPGAGEPRTRFIREQVD